MSDNNSAIPIEEDGETSGSDIEEEEEEMEDINLEADEKENKEEEKKEEKGFDSSDSKSNLSGERGKKNKKIEKEGKEKESMTNQLKNALQKSLFFKNIIGKKERKDDNTGNKKNSSGSDTDDDDDENTEKNEGKKGKKKVKKKRKKKVQNQKEGNDNSNGINSTSNTSSSDSDSEDDGDYFKSLIKKKEIIKRKKEKEKKRTKTLMKIKQRDLDLSDFSSSSSDDDDESDTCSEEPIEEKYPEIKSVLDCANRIYSWREEKGDTLIIFKDLKIPTFSFIIERSSFLHNKLKKSKNKSKHKNTCYTIELEDTLIELTEYSLLFVLQWLHGAVARDKIIPQNSIEFPFIIYLAIKWNLEELVDSFYSEIKFSEDIKARTLFDMASEICKFKEMLKTNNKNIEKEEKEFIVKLNNAYGLIINRFKNNLRESNRFLFSPGIKENQFFELIGDDINSEKEFDVKEQILKKKLTPVILFTNYIKNLQISFSAEEVTEKKIKKTVLANVIDKDGNKFYFNSIIVSARIEAYEKSFFGGLISKEKNEIKFSGNIKEFLPIIKYCHFFSAKELHLNKFEMNGLFSLLIHSESIFLEQWFLDFVIFEIKKKIKKNIERNDLLRSLCFLMGKVMKETFQEIIDYYSDCIDLNAKIKKNFIIEFCNLYYYSSSVSEEISKKKKS